MLFNKFYLYLVFLQRWYELKNVKTFPFNIKIKKSKLLIIFVWLTLFVNL